MIARDKSLQVSSLNLYFELSEIRSSIAVEVLYDEVIKTSFPFILVKINAKG